MSSPAVDTRAYPPASSWGSTGGLWHDETGTPRDRDYWRRRYLGGRGRPPVLPEPLWDEARDLRVLYHAGAVTSRQVADALGLSKRTALNFLSYRVLWWL